jgi:hypothetical protein
VGADALVVYDDLGNVHMQVFEPGPGGVRRIVWEGSLGRVRRLPSAAPGSAQFGNQIEPWVRGMVQRATGQRFRRKRSNAPGPDLQVTVRRVQRQAR